MPAIRESDAYDDDPDHFGVVDLEHQDDAETEVPAPWAFVGLALVLLISVLIMVWSGVFTYG